MSNIPPSRWMNRFSPFLYRNLNPTERTFCRLKDFQRIATGDDRLVRNYLAAVCLVAASATDCEFGS
jgi:putative transposase